MIVSGKSQQNLSEYIQFLFKIRFEFIKYGIISKKTQNFRREILNPLYEHQLLASVFFRHS